MLRIETFSRKRLGRRRQYHARIVNEENGKQQWRTSEGYQQPGRAGRGGRGARHGRAPGDRPGAAVKPTAEDLALVNAFHQGRSCSLRYGYAADCPHGYGSLLWEAWMAGFEDEESVVYALASPAARVEAAKRGRVPAPFNAVLADALVKAQRMLESGRACRR